MSRVIDALRKGKHIARVEDAIPGDLVSTLGGEVAIIDRVDIATSSQDVDVYYLLDVEGNLFLRRRSELR